MYVFLVFAITLSAWFALESFILIFLFLLKDCDKYILVSVLLLLSCHKILKEELKMCCNEHVLILFILSVFWQPERQTTMWSATWPTEVQNLAQSYMTDNVQVQIGHHQLTVNDDIEQNIIVVEDDLDKLHK